MLEIYIDVNTRNFKKIHQVIVKENRSEVVTNRGLINCIISINSDQRREMIIINTINTKKATVAAKQPI